MRLIFAVAAMTCAGFVGAQERTLGADSGNERHDRDVYRPPTGFGGYVWNTPLGEFRRLAPEPVYVRIAHSQGHVADLDLDCVLEGSTVGQCSDIQGEGFHALTEYYVDSQGFRLNDSARQAKTVLFPITYQFCAQWVGFSNQLRGDVLQQLRLCGARLFFQSETARQESEIRDFDYVTSARRVLNWLIANHGDPEGYERKGTVIVGIPDAPLPIAQRKSRYDNWYWCRPKIDDMTPRCDASIVYTFDSETGRGQVILLTAPVWMYAHARRFGGSEDDPLYRVLHGNFEQAPVRHICTGSFLCKPPPPRPMSDQMMARFRLPNTNANEPTDAR